MIHIPQNEYINKIDEYKKSVENKFKKFNCKLEKLINADSQVNFTTDKINDKNLKEKIKPIYETSNNIIKLYNGNDLNKDINMEDIKNIILESLDNVKKHYKNIKSNLNPVSNNNPSEDINKLKSLNDKYKKIFEKTIVKLIEEIENFIKLLNDFVNYSKNLKKYIQDIKAQSENLFNNIKKLEGDKLIKDLYSKFSIFFECFGKHKEYLDRIKKFIYKVDIFKSLQLISDKINNLIELNNLNNNSKININLILKEINLFEQIKQNQNCLDKYYIKNKFFKNIESFTFNILFIFDITSTMGKHINYFVKNFDKIIQGIKENCPLSIIYTGFIGYKDINDLELGDEYIDIDFTLFYDDLKQKIKNIQAEGGDDVPEDVAGAFELALNKEWNKGTDIIFLVTDAPCHGIKYHDLDQKVEDLKDNFPEEEYGDNQIFKREKIEKLVEKFVENDFNLICLDIQHKNTEKMFKMFEEKYKEKNKEKLFCVSKDEFDKCVLKKITELYKQKDEKVILSLVHSYNEI